MAHQCPHNEWPKFIYLLFAEPPKSAKKFSIAAGITNTQPYPVTTTNLHAQWFVSLRTGDISQRCASFRSKITWTAIPAAYKDPFARYIAAPKDAANVSVETAEDIIIDDA